MVHVPGPTMVTTPEEDTVHTLEVLDVYVNEPPCTGVVAATVKFGSVTSFDDCENDNAG